MKHSNGNALFLILIAVALFAALSYALTSSGRGGGSIDREQAEIYAGQIYNEVSKIHSAYDRFVKIGGIEEIHLNEENENASGTCYVEGTATTPCSTVGIFNSTDGQVSKIIYPDAWKSSTYSGPVRWNLVERQVIINGADLNTTLMDTVLMIHGISDQICESINLRTNNDKTIGVLSLSGGTNSGYARLSGTLADGTYEAISNTASAPAYTMSVDGCNALSGVNYGIFVVDSK